MPLYNGQILQNRYQIIQPLGKGGMGAVYLAQDNRLGGKRVAIKEFDPAVLSPQDRQWATAAFTQEALMLAQLTHPSLTAVTDHFDENQLLYLVMEYVTGETLEQAWFRQPGRRFDAPQVIAWAGELCAVLDYLHTHTPPIIFRDLKPGNIMVQPDGRLKLIDFGIARYFKPGQTRDTVVLGTPGYAPPEQHGRQQADARSDIYALAAVLHQLLTGYDPTATPFNLPPLTSLQVPAHIAKTINKALSLDPGKRPTAATQFYDMLNPASRHASKARSLSAGIVIVILLGLLMLITGGMLGGWWATAPNILPAMIGFGPTMTPTAMSSVTPTPTNTATTTLSPTLTVTPVPPTDTAVPSTDTPTATIVIMCTPPACSLNEVYFCAGDCPGGCGTTCATVTPPPPPMIQSYTLTQSAGRRSINVTRIGNGVRHIVLIGTVRGAESPDSGQVVTRLRDYFQTNSDLVPARFALTFIQTLNPDGLAANSRYNATGVDLNRNWDTPSWRANAPQPTGIVNGSGGVRPFSEPETAALSDLLLNLQNSSESVQVIAFHYHAGTPAQGEIIPGYRTYYTPEINSTNLAQSLNRTAGYKYEPYWAGSYIPTGEMIQWCALQNMAAVDIILPRGVSPDSRPSGQSRSIFEAALAGIMGLFN